MRPDPADPLADAVYLRPGPVSVVVTTYGSDTRYTQACLEAIRRWKNGHHELIVVTHDETPLLRAYLEACAAEGLVDRLVYAAPGHGHTRGFNLGVTYATADVVFHVSNDMEVGPALVDDCAHKLRHDPQLGLIGWHWYGEGARWRDGRLADCLLKNPAEPYLPPAEEANVRNAPWFTGRAFAGLGGPRHLHLCNTSFFGARRAVLDRAGGGFGPEYPHYWADDFLCYAVLDQGLDVRHFEEKFRRPEFLYEHAYRHLAVPDRRRHDDALACDAPSLPAVGLLGGGMTEAESVFLHTLARAVPDGATVTNVGLWRGSSAVVLMDALRGKRVNFHLIDAFDLPGVSAMSGQGPVGRDECLKYLEPFVGPRHTVRVVRANTLDLDRFPRSDFVFVDAGHTEECITHDARLARVCLTPRGVAAFHDYGCPAWPAVKPALDRAFPGIESHGTVAVHRAAPAPREEYAWPDPRPAVRPAHPPVGDRA